MQSISSRPGSVTAENTDQAQLPVDLFVLDDTAKQLSLKDGWNFKGMKGDAGNNGVTYFEGTIYKQSAVLPDTPTGGSFNFATNTLVAPSSWLVNEPNATITPTYKCTFLFETADASATITATTWTVPTVCTVAGADGIVAIYSEVDGGQADTIYLVDEVIDGGGANG